MKNNGISWESMWRIAICVIVMLGAMRSSATTIQHIHYSPTSLPSEQGWAYHWAEYVDESDAFALVGDLLHLDTIGLGWSAFCYYEHELTIDPNVSYVSATIRVRINEVESEYDTDGFGFIVAYGVPNGPTRTVAFQLSATSVAHYPEYWVHLIDNTQWHEYTITIALGSGECKLLVDDIVIRQWMEPDESSATGVLFGDNVAPPNVCADIAAVDVWLSSEGAVVVEEVSWSTVKSLFAAGD